MARPAIKWIISDTHFFHDAMIEACGRPVDFTDRIITNCKHLIATQDTLYHLGDVIFYKYPSLKELLDSFPCRKILVMGNHDRKGEGWYQRNGFDAAVDRLIIGDVMLSHKAEKELPSWVRLNVHGHWHNSPRGSYPDWWTESRYYHFSLEATKLMPLRWEQVVIPCQQSQPVS